jgi:serine protease
MRPRHALLPLLAALALSACQDDLPTRPQTRVLVPDSLLTIGGGQGSSRTYTLEVPAGTAVLRVLLFGGFGDADLAIRYGAPPSSEGADCVSETEFDIEECLIEAPTAGTWYVLVFGYTNYSDVSLLPNVFAVGGSTPLTSGVDLSGLSGAPGDFDLFQLAVPAGADSLVVTMNATGDVDLYVDRERVPTLNNYECASFTDTGSERCVVPAPASGLWRVRLEAFGAYSAGTLRATVFVPPTP